DRAADSEPLALDCDFPAALGLIIGARLLAECRGGQKGKEDGQSAEPGSELPPPHCGHDSIIPFGVALRSGRAGPSCLVFVRRRFPLRNSTGSEPDWFAGR